MRYLRTLNAVHWIDRNRDEMVTRGIYERVALIIYECTALTETQRDYGNVAQSRGTTPTLPHVPDRQRA